MNETQPENQSVPDPGSATPPPSEPHQGTGERHAHQTGHHTKGFFDQIRGLGVRRGSDRWVAGVCAGVARRFSVDPLIIRAAMIVLLLFGIGFLAYLIAWALLPDESGSILAEKGIRDGDAWGITILVVIAIAVFGTGPWFSNGRGWGGPLVAIGALALIWYLITQRKKSDSPSHPEHSSTTAPAGTFPTAGGPTAPHTGAPSPQPAWASGTSSVGYEPPPASEQAGAGQGHAGQASGAYQSTAYQSAPEQEPKAKRAGLAGLLLVLGAAILGYGIGVGFSGSSFIGLLAATGAAALATVLLGALGRRSVLSSLLSLGLAVSLLGSWGAVQMPQGGFGEQLWRPVVASEQTTYSWAMGQATLDLRGITEQPQQQDIDATVSFGQLIVHVPEDVTTRVIASAQFGSIVIDGAETASGRENRGGTSITDDRTFGTGEPELIVRANARFGQVTIISSTSSS